MKKVIFYLLLLFFSVHLSAHSILIDQKGNEYESSNEYLSVDLYKDIIGKLSNNSINGTNILTKFRVKGNRVLLTSLKVDGVEFLTHEKWAHWIDVWTGHAGKQMNTVTIQYPLLYEKQVVYYCSHGIIEDEFHYDNDKSIFAFHEEILQRYKESEHYGKCLSIRFEEKQLHIDNCSFSMEKEEGSQLYEEQILAMIEEVIGSKLTPAHLKVCNPDGAPLYAYLLKPQLKWVEVKKE